MTVTVGLVLLLSSPFAFAKVVSEKSAAQAEPGDKKGTVEQKQSQNIPSTGIGVGLGDQIILDVDTPGFFEKDSSDNSERYAPAGTTLEIDSDTGGTFYVHALGMSTGGFALPTCSDHEPVSYTSDKKKKGKGTATSKQSPEQRWGLQEIDCGTEYLIDKKYFVTHGIQYTGIEYGILVIPYKFHISDRSLTPGGTVGAYAGIHASTIAGMTVSFIGSAGIGAVSEATAGPNGTASESSHAAFTLASGFVLTFTKTGKFQLGLLVGLDFAGSGTGYRYEGKPWLALSFGTSLTK